ncbi:MAG TPA: hypothetical protein VM513_11545 [Kofleriaceae bacterium]|jgi:hypothetical protein|nr:hypothetical protein [Kofleriaceae bacterium]
MKYEPLVVDDLDAFLEGGRRLKELDPERFARVLALVRAYVAVYEREDEAMEVFASRRAEIAPRKVKALA